MIRSWTISHMKSGVEYLTGLLKEQGSFRRTAPGSRLRDWKSHGASGKSGYDMIGVDNSEEMLELALERRKNPEAISSISARI